MAQGESGTVHSLAEQCIHIYVSLPSHFSSLYLSIILPSAITSHARYTSEPVPHLLPFNLCSLPAAEEVEGKEFNLEKDVIGKQIMNYEKRKTIK